MNTDSIGRIIKEKRKEIGLTQEQLAEQLNLNPKTVSRWERGTNVPDVSVLNSIAEVLSVDVEELVLGKTKENQVKTSPDQRPETRVIRHKTLYETNRTITVCLIICTVVFADILFGYLSTSLKWNVSNRVFVPEGIIISLLFGKYGEARNEDGKIMVKALSLLIACGFLEVLMIVLKLMISARCLQEKPYDGNKRELKKGK